MYVIVWQFEVAAENAARFLAAYGSEGDWAQLFRRASGYLGTELLRSSDTATRYITIDRWQTAEDFTRFRQDFADEYQALDARMEALTVSEVKIGVFTGSD